MFNVRKDLIKDELNAEEERGFVFSYHKLSNRFIDWLFNHYHIASLCECFYDSEPDFDEEEYNMYLDYKKNTGRLTGLAFWNMISNMDEIQEKGEDFRYSKEEHTEEELKVTYEKVEKAYRDHEEVRLSFNNWIEPYFKGNWGLSQETVDAMGRKILKHIRTFPKTIRDRLYVSVTEESARIYFYGRDHWEKDYWFYFEKGHDYDP